MSRHMINRRTILRGAGASLALPMLDGMIGTKPTNASESKEKAGASPKRFVGILIPFGISPGYHPTQAGKNYAMSKVLSTLEKNRNDMTVITEIDHGVKGGHQATHTALSGILHTQAAGFADGNISLDQYLAEFSGSKTRYSSMCLGSTGRIGAGWTRAGVAVPPITTPQKLFEKLFVEMSSADKKAKRKLLASGNSILDAVNSSAKSFARKLNKKDQGKLDEYLTSVRETEQGLKASSTWLEKPLPKTNLKMPNVKASDVEGYMASWYDLMVLALQTDSTRVMTLSPMSSISPSLLDGVSNGYHALSHHGREESRVAQLRLTDIFVLKHLGRFYDKLKQVKQADGETLMDSTMTVFTSGMGNGSRHDNENVPFILAGGGYQHGQHIKAGYKQPLCNVYLNLAQRFGVETDRFGTSKSTFDELKLA